eukprot:COSAG04_NODE_355_length_16048_cov_133.443511_5_plen_1065_part_00
MTIDTGSGNPGAVGLDHISNNIGGVEHLRIVSADGDGAVGFDFSRQLGGLTYFSHLEVQGFVTGINISSGAIGAALEHATISRCQVGLRVTDKLVSARNVTTVNVKQPVLVSGADASLILLDSTLGASAQTAAAVRSPDGAQLYLRNVTAAGAFAAVNDSGAQVASPVSEYSHSPPFSLFPGSPRHSTFANVPILSTPITIREPPSSWRVVNVDLLAKATVTEALQAALDGARTVFLRRNDALVPRTRRTNPDEPREGGPLIKQVVLRKQLRRLHGGWIGLGSALGADTPAGFMNVVVDDADHSEPVTIESIDVTGILHSSRNELIIRHVFAHHPAATCFATAQRPQLGDVFIESFQPKNTGGDTQPVGGPGLQIIASAPGSVRVWARALDIEGTLRHVENRGGDLWVLGSKFGEIQGDPTVLAAGGRTELLGGLLNGGTPANTTMVFENESDASVIGFAFRFRDNGETFEERLDGQSKSVAHDAFPERQTWECIGQRHDGQPDCRWEVGNWLPFFRTHTESSDDRAGCFGALRHAGCLGAPRGCDVCAGQHQRVMKVAGCTDAQIEEWCGSHAHALKLDDESLAAAGPRADGSSVESSDIDTMHPSFHCVRAAVDPSDVSDEALLDALVNERPWSSIVSEQIWWVRWMPKSGREIVDALAECARSGGSALTESDQEKGHDRGVADAEPKTDTKDADPELVSAPASNAGEDWSRFTTRRLLGASVLSSAICYGKYGLDHITFCTGALLLNGLDQYVKGVEHWSAGIFVLYFVGHATIWRFDDGTGALGIQFIMFQLLCGCIEFGCGAFPAGSISRTVCYTVQNSGEARLFWTLLHNIRAEMAEPMLTACIAVATSGFVITRLRQRGAESQADGASNRAPDPQHAPAEDDQATDMINVLMMQDREKNQKLMEHRAQALKLRNEGFPIPVRIVGDIDCETRRERLHERVPVEGSFPHRPGRSALQDLIVSDWHPMRVVVGEDGAPREVVNKKDPKLLQIEKAYPGLGAADFVLSVWQELLRFNSSGGYTVEIPWHVAQKRELTPTEVTDIVARGKGKRKKKTRGRG